MSRHQLRPIPAMRKASGRLTWIHEWDVSDESTVTRGTPTNTLNALADKAGSCDLTPLTLNSYGIGPLSNGLNGVGIYSVGNANRLIGSAFSVLSVPATPVIVSLVASQSNLAQWAHFDLGTGQRPHLYGFGDTQMAVFTAVTDALNDTAVHHYVCVFNGANSELWIDGVREATGDTASGATAATIALGSVVGGSLDSFSYIGQMRVSTDPPTASKIAREAAEMMDKWGL